MANKNPRKVIEELEEFSAQWVKFRNFIDTEPLTPQLESEFSKIKESITSHHRNFLAYIEFDIEIAQSMLETVGRIATPNYVNNLTDAVRHVLEEEWNSAYLLIQETLGIYDYMVEKRSQWWNPANLFRASPSKKKTQEASNYIKASRAGLGVKKISRNIYLKLVFLILVFTGVVYVIIQLNLIEEFTAYLP